jgi:hypothetical protein
LLYRYLKYVACKEIENESVVDVVTPVVPLLLKPLLEESLPAEMPTLTRTPDFEFIICLAEIIVLESNADIDDSPAVLTCREYLVGI